jgi:DNA-binding MarR family transcriptional regulator
MTPTQHKILDTLSETEPSTRWDIVEKTGLDYSTVSKALYRLINSGNVVCGRDNRFQTLFLAKQEEVTPFESTTARAIRLRPVLHNIFWQGVNA